LGEAGGGGRIVVRDGEGDGAEREHDRGSDRGAARARREAATRRPWLEVVERVHRRRRGLLEQLTAVEERLFDRRVVCIVVHDRHTDTR
jgi:hypothetical protein